MLVILPLLAVLAAEETKQTPQPTESPVVAAVVDGRPIYVNDVHRRMARVFGQREIESTAKPMFEAETLAQLVERQLVLRFLEQRQMGATVQDLDAEFARIKRQLAQQDLTLGEHLARTQQTQEEFTEIVRWNVTWQRYLEQQLTDENLQKFFEAHRREFDGAELRVAHILLKPATDNDATALETTIAQAEKIRKSIVAGELDFAEAAKKYSVSPTADQGGDIGIIGRKGPMPEIFSKAAFALGVNSVSEPVVTPFGVHLIQVLEIKPGDKTWNDVRSELVQAVTAHLFNWAAEQQRPHSKVEFTGASPFFKLGTKQLSK
jgi:parvulin-like peptidyl-prolyl isomerase